MHTRFFTIAGGNKTALVWDCDPQDRLLVTKKLLSHVEQVGFVEQRERPHLTMMGNELCINALLALAAHEGNEGTLSINDLSLSYINTDTQTRIIINLPYTKKDNLILFNSIGFLHTHEPLSTEALRTYPALHDLPAFGSLACTPDGRITPVIYVVETDSIKEESACGSGSIAAHLATGLTEITQPTGEVISVKRSGDAFVIEACVQLTI